MKPAEKRRLVREIMEQYQVSIQQACKIMDLSRSVYYYQPKRENDEIIVQAINQLHERYPFIGFWQIFHRLRQQGHPWNHKRVLRVYRSLKLKLTRRKTKKKIKRKALPLDKPETVNQCWSMDFMSDQFGDGTTFRTLNIIDDFNREALCMETGKSIPTKQVIRKLDELIDFRGKPESLRSDNGPEFIAKAIEQWCKSNNIVWKYIQPGKPTQNAFVERFNGTVRQELYNLHIFDKFAQVRELVESWQRDYNENRPHKGLKYKTPLEYAQANKGEIPIGNCPN